MRSWLTLAFASSVALLAGCAFIDGLSQYSKGDQLSAGDDGGLAGDALDGSDAPTVDGGVGPGDDAGGLDSGNHDASLPSVPTDGLVAYYRGSGIDLSGNGNNATYNGGVVLTADRFGHKGLAGLFDGSTTTYIEVANHPLLPVGASPRTVSVWILTSHPSGSVAEDIWNWGSSAARGERFGMLVLNRADFFCGESDDVPGTDILNDGLWHNVIVTFDGNTVTILVDNVQNTVGVPNSGIPLDTVGTYLEIGRSTYNHSFPEPYFGVIDQVRIYNRVLMPSELAALFNEGGWN
jgi:hypothetical protein